MSEERNSTITVTSENRAEFMAEKMGLKAEPEVLATEKVELEPQTEEASLEPKDDTSDRTSKPHKIEKRFSEITRERNAERERAERAEREIQELKAKVETKVEPKQSDELIEPDRTKYTDAFEYAKDLADFAAKNAMKQRDLQEQKAKAEAERQLVYTNWQKQLNAARAEIADFDEVLASTEAGVPDHLSDAMMDSDVGAKILYHLAEHPEIAQKLSEMSMAKALRELGKLEFQLESPKEIKTESVTKVSKAPQPITPVKGGSNIDAFDSDKLSFQEHKALRKAGKLK